MIEYGVMHPEKGWQVLVDVEVMDHIPTRGTEVLLTTGTAGDLDGGVTSAYYTVAHVVWVVDSMYYPSNERTVRKHSVRIVLTDNNLPAAEVAETTQMPVDGVKILTEATKPKKGKWRGKR